MNPALLGSISALGWGAADFVARFTGVRLGVVPALTGMLFAGMIGTGLLIAPGWSDVPWSLAGILWAAFTGLAAVTAYGLFYWTLVKGPVTVVSPLVGVFPVFNVLIAVVEGRPPSVPELAAMGLVLAGVYAVCRFGPAGEDGRVQLRPAVAVAALVAAFLFAITVWAGQKAVVEIGDLPTAWIVRAVGFVLLLPVLLITIRRGDGPEGPISPGWWGLIVLQAALDTIGLVAVISAAGPGAEIAVVISSAFTGVTVILARLFLREPMRLPQWAGIGMIIAGGAALSALALP